MLLPPSCNQQRNSALLLLLLLLLRLCGADCCRQVQLCFTTVACKHSCQ
jgi:hypothetical protein